MSALSRIDAVTVFLLKLDTVWTRKTSSVGSSGRKSRRVSFHKCNSVNFRTFVPRGATQNRRYASRKLNRQRAATSGTGTPAGACMAIPLFEVDALLASLDVDALFLCLRPSLACCVRLDIWFWASASCAFSCSVEVGIALVTVLAAAAKVPVAMLLLVVGSFAG